MSHYGVFWRERFGNLRDLLKEMDPARNETKEMKS